ncbi:MAG: Holliday junction branch migration protein RuvA [Proteobacteria bacterium]|nr:Holliday junction branch migration protein RuvA [Pseudomonadota bacterium]
MIGQLRGKLIEKQPPFLMIEVGGVGYLLQAPLSTFFNLPDLGQEVVLRTHFIVREDAHVLYGFITQQECRLFQEIIKVNGVGPKVALAILSGLSPQEFANCVMAQEVTRLQKLPGIGAKIAQRILVEMQDKLSKLDFGLTAAHSMMVLNKAVSSDPLQEAIAALVSLGYKHTEAAKAVAKVQDQTQSCEHIIKEALQGLAKV